MTVGEDRVRVKFNPSDNDTVSVLKQKTAEIIDLCEIQRAQVHGINPELVRLWALAQTSFEEAAMWAVKAATG